MPGHFLRDIMTILNINGIDYSSNVIVGTYKVNDIDVYESWTDGWGQEHRRILRQRASGSFNMQFRSPDEYASFCQHIKNSKTDSGYVPCYLAINNLGINSMKSAQMYFNFEPTRSRLGDYRHDMGVISVEVSEV